MYQKQMEMTAEEMKVQLIDTADGSLHLVHLKQQSNKTSKAQLRRWMRWLKNGKQRS